MAAAGTLCYCGKASVPRASKRSHTKGQLFWGCPEPAPCAASRGAAFLGWCATPAQDGQGVPVARERSRSRSPAPVVVPPALSLELRCGQLQARLDMGGDGAVPLTRPCCNAFQLRAPSYPPGRRNDKAFLDGRAVDVRLVDLEVHLCQRLSPPQAVAQAAVAYPGGRLKWVASLFFISELCFFQDPISFALNSPTGIHVGHACGFHGRPASSPCGGAWRGILRNSCEFL